jgi:hypothetical protein
MIFCNDRKLTSILMCFSNIKILFK